MERKEAIRSAYRLTGGNKPFWKKLMYRAFSTAQKHCDTWHDYEMDVAPYENSKPIYYEFTAWTAADATIPSAAIRIHT